MGSTTTIWMRQAACLGSASIADWYADRGTREHDAAIEVCRRCAVRAQCLEMALQTEEAFGLWGGYTPAQRDRIRFERKQEGRRLVVNPRPSSFV